MSPDTHSAEESLLEIEQLRSRLRELEHVYEEAPVGLFVLDTDLRYIRINERLANMNGKPVAAHIGRTLGEIIPEKCDALEPIFRQVLRTGIAITDHEIALSTPDGGIAEYAAGYYPLRSGNGNTVGVCGVVRDVTAKRTRERELRESEARYRFLAESLPQFVWTVDSSGRIEYRNLHLLEYTGISGEEKSLDGFARTVHPDDLPRVFEVVGFASKNHRDFEIELRIRRASDHKYRWFLAKAIAQTTANGNCRWLGIAVDIDERRRAEQTRSLLASMVESSADAIIGLDPQGLITSWNPAATGLFGYNAEEAIGRPVSFLNSRPSGDAAIPGIGGVGSGEHTERYETIRTGRNGEELTVLVVVTPIRDERGRVTGAFKTVRDVTAQRRVERELSAAAERLRLVQRAVNAGTWELDIVTGAVYWSPELYQLYGLPADGAALDLRRWLHQVYPEDVENVQGAIQRSIRGRSELRIQYRTLVDGELRWLTAFGGIVGENGGIRMVGITIDTTEIYRTEETVRQTARLEGIGRLAGGVAHDFNNLLAGILGGASFIGEILPPDHPARSMLDLIIRSSERAARLTGQLLAYAGKGTFTLRPVDLSRTVQDSFSLLSGSIPNNVELVVQTGWDLPLAQADTNQLRETVLNLVTNAVEAIGDNPGTIRVRTGIDRLDRSSVEKRFGEHPTSPGTYVYLEVEDSGEGMTPEVQRRIFEPFFTTKFTGRGLGLSAVQGIVRAHNGAMEVMTEPGKGSTFRILLPIASVREIETKALGQAGRRGRLVLVIDDEAAVRSVAQAALERAGYEVLAAPDGLLGLEIFRERQRDISLVILDVSMPKMAGPEVHEEFVKAGIDIPIVVTSGYPQGEAMKRIPADRVAGFISKPFNVRELSAMVDRLIGSSTKVKPN